MKSKHNTARRLTANVITIILLAACLTVTTFALLWVTVVSENHLFHTGRVEINLNDGKPVIEEHEFLFEPGMLVKKTFFIENNSTWDVYYKLYFDNVSGDLADVLEIQILSGDTVLYAGTAAQLSKNAVQPADDVLKIQQRKELTITFRFPETVGNSAQDAALKFDFCADAVQTKNNPYKLFS